MNKEFQSFSLPKKTYIIQSNNMHIILELLLIIGPLIIVAIVGCLSILSELGFGIIFAASLFFVLIITQGGTRRLCKPVRKYVHRFQHHFALKWILNNIECTKCGGKIIVKKPFGNMEDFFFQHKYICKNCNKIYEIEVMPEGKNKWIFKLKN